MDLYNGPPCTVIRSPTVVEMGEGDNMSVVKESSGFHVLEVDNTGSGDGQGWSWVEVICVLMAVNCQKEGGSRESNNRYV